MRARERERDSDDVAEAASSREAEIGRLIQQEWLNYHATLRRIGEEADARRNAAHMMFANKCHAIIVATGPVHAQNSMGVEDHTDPDT